MTLRRGAALALTLSLAVPRAARAYDEDVHSFLARAALANAGLDAPAPPIPAGAPAAVLAMIDTWARTSTDAAIRAEWTRRYPAPDNFDAWAAKELFLLAPAASVHGIDRLPELGATLREVVELGARQPDDDRRNRERLAYDARRAEVKDATGAPVPADPALLNMGKLGALSSQAHAHYGLAAVELSADPEVLKSEPRRFAVASGYPPGPVLTLAAEMTELHLELALLAGLADEPSPSLAWLYTGHAFHYLQDVTNQIHTVQVGLYDFFVDATIQQLLLSLRTGGGYLGELRTMPSIGIDILTNHHVLSEQLTRKRLQEALAGRETPEGARLAAAPKSDDRELVAALEQALAPFGERAWASPFGEALTRATIEASSREGADVYAATRAIADPDLRKEGVLFDEHEGDPDASILPAGERDAQAYEALFALQERAFRRAGTAMRRWVAIEHQALAMDGDARTTLRDAVLERLVRRQLRLLGEAEARRADYLARPPPEAAGPVRMPVVLAAEIAVLVIAALIVRRILRRRTAA